MKKIWCIALLLVLLLLTFCGCTPTIANIDDLMRPPKLSGENAGIQEAFEAATANKTVQMKTPTAGLHRSSYVLYDIDGDEQEEVITFYGDAADKTAAYMHVLDYSDGRWQSVADIKGKGSEVYKIDFCDMNQDGFSEIVVCWSLFESRGSKLLTVYAPSFTESAQTVRELLSESFTQSVILDINNDGRDEIFLVEITSALDQSLTTGKVLAMDPELGIYSMGSVTLTPAVSILLLQSQPASADMPALIYIDSAINDTTAVTDIVYWDNQNFRLLAPLSQENLTEFSKTARARTLPSTDIDQDGRLEIPVTGVLEGSVTVSGTTEEPLEMTTWLEYAGGSLSADESCLMLYASSYKFSLSREEAADFIIVNDTSERLCAFYHRGRDGRRGALLFSVLTVPHAEWERKAPEGFTDFASAHALTYAYQITESGTQAGINETYITTRFSILSE